MNCPMQNGPGAAFLLDFAARRLNPSQEKLLAGHLAVCNSCADFVQAQRSLWEALDDWDRIEITAGFNRRLYDQIEQERRRAPLARWASSMCARWTPLSWRTAVSVAAVCAALFFAVLRPTGSRLDHSLSAQPGVDTIDAEQVERSLEDLEMLKEFNRRL